MLLSGINRKGIDMRDNSPWAEIHRETQKRQETGEEVQKEERRQIREDTNKEKESKREGIFNLSGQQLTQEEIGVHDKGLKFAPI